MPRGLLTVSKNKNRIITWTQLYVIRIIYKSYHNKSLKKVNMELEN